MKGLFGLMPLALTLQVACAAAQPPDRATAGPLPTDLQLTSASLYALLTSTAAKPAGWQAVKGQSFSDLHRSLMAQTSDRRFSIDGHELSGMRSALASRQQEFQFIDKAWGRADAGSADTGSMDLSRARQELIPRQQPTLDLVKTGIAAMLWQLRSLPIHDGPKSVEGDTRQAAWSNLRAAVALARVELARQSFGPSAAALGLTMSEQDRDAIMCLRCSLRPPVTPIYEGLETEELALDRLLDSMDGHWFGR